MFSTHIDHANTSESPQNISDPLGTASSEAIARSEKIIRWLPLLAANDFLDDDDYLPPAA